MNNPLKGWYSDLFGSRGVDVAAALNYVDELAAASSDAIAVQTAARVLLNTVIGAVDQILTSRSPEKLAILELIDARIAEKAVDIDQQISDWMDSNVDHDNLISEWMSDNFDVNDYNVDDVVSDKISEWASDNLADEITECVKANLTFRVILD